MFFPFRAWGRGFRRPFLKRGTQGFPLSPRTLVIVLTLQSWGSRVLEAPSPGGDPRIPCTPGTQQGTRHCSPTSNLVFWMEEVIQELIAHHSLTHSQLWGSGPGCLPPQKERSPCLPGTDLSVCPLPPVLSHGITSHQVILSSSCSLKGVPAIVFHYLLASFLEFRIFPEFCPLQRGQKVS